MAPVRRLFEQIVHPLATAQTPGAFFKGWRLMGLDGTVYNVPDSPANAVWIDILPPPGAQSCMASIPFTARFKMTCCR